MRARSPVLLTLAGTAALAAVSFGFLGVAPNRLADGLALPLWGAPLLAKGAVAASLGALLALSFAPKDRGGAMLVAGAALVLASCFAAGDFAAALADPGRPAERISLGAAFWSLAACGFLVMLDAARRGVPALLIAAVCAGLLLMIIVMAREGVFADLALAREFIARRAEFASAFETHLFLVGAGVFMALVISAPLTMLALQDQRARGALFATLGVVQTIPSIALFGALIAPLSALVARFPQLAEWGVGGTGATPAIIALTLYSAPPLVRFFSTGFEAAAPDAKEAALGLGFDPRQIFCRVSLPLALPALISGLRVVTVQAIGLAAVAALIGAGGLGVFIFQGVGQYALDLVLLGAVPVILLALAADLLFQAALAMVRRRL